MDFPGLLNEPCRFPQVDEQRRVSTAIAEAQSEIALLHDLVALRKLQIRGLMQKLLTGQWRLPVRDEETA